jgi:hypothetical protein
MQSDEGKYTSILLCVAAICFCICTLCYTIRKIFKCFLHCRHGTDYRNIVFKAGLRGDSSTDSTPQNSPNRDEYDPLTPPVRDGTDLV